MVTPGEESTAVDGRTARRDRNRTAVLDAILDLIQEGNPLPTVAEISERSGTSHRDPLIGRTESAAVGS